jgi:hypothetical protein
MAAKAEARMEAECTFQPRLTSRQLPTGTSQENRDPEVYINTTLHILFCQISIAPTNAHCMVVLARMLDACCNASIRSSFLWMTGLSIGHKS